MAGSENKDSASGKKTFFLYPPTVVGDRLVKDLLKRGYEVHVIKTHDQAVPVLRRFPDSILFINIDSGLKEAQWEEYIRNLTGDTSLRDVRIGILSYNEDQRLIKKYLIGMNIPCGFIRLKLGVEESTRIIMKALEANEARGRRKYVRALCEGSNLATFNMKVGDRIISGRIIDISVVGMAFSFGMDVGLKTGDILNDIQLNLKGSRCRIFGHITGQHREHKDRYILLFDSRTGVESVDKINDYIYRFLQEELQRMTL